MADYKKPDYWQIKARKENYPARSVYKLQELDARFTLIKPGRDKPYRILDLGASPGSWSLYILRKTAGRVNVRVVAVDLAPLSREYDKGLFDSPQFTFIQGDLTGAETEAAIRARGPYALILSDAAPATSGSRGLDADRSLELAGAVIRCGETALESGGSLAFKVFQGRGSGGLPQTLKPRFTRVKSFKPQACRAESVETYYVAQGARPAPETIAFFP
jgi:23S rRNA (uridine2552-2'-O)-methyltransferase